MTETAKRNAELIRARTSHAPTVAVVLGSGLGGFTNELSDAAVIPYGELDGFPATGVSGHSGSLHIGGIGEVPIAVLAGRGHYYEDARSDSMRAALETLKALGVADLILTNAGGSLREEIPPGSVTLITDHINFANRNPLIGEQGDARFVGLSHAYDAHLRRSALAAADSEAIHLHEGVYIWFSGPSFETPAEIRAARFLGADIAGMSTVPEVILARFLEMRVLAFSVIVNYAAGMTSAELSHEETKTVAPLGGEKLTRILKRLLSAWPQ
jgi:purine-nucleoside phosphorylase